MFLGLTRTESIANIYRRKFLRNCGSFQVNHGGACANHYQSSRGRVCLRGLHELTASPLPQFKSTRTNVVLILALAAAVCCVMAAGGFFRGDYGISCKVGMEFVF